MAIAVTPASIQARFPEFAKVEPDTIQIWIDDALCNVNETQWAKRATMAVEFLTAHCLKLFADPDCEEPSAGPVSSEREGQVAATYKIAEMFAKDDLGSTVYGRRFLTLRKRLFVTRKI